MIKFKSFLKLPSSQLPTKTVVVTSSKINSGKTSLIETVVGEKLNWKVSELCSDLFVNEKIKCAKVVYDGYLISIFELPPIPTADLYSKEITDLIVNADLVVELFPFNGHISLTNLNDLFDQNIGNQPISSLIGNKKVFVYTKAENPDELTQWWNSLSDEERTKRNEWNAVRGNPNFSTFIEAASYERALCMGLYPYDCPNENIFETSTLTMKNIDALTTKCKQILLG